MIIRYGAKNFYCFKEGVEISFELTANCPTDISREKSISNLICLKGANGSGKTNALKVLPFLKEFCTNSFNRKPEDFIHIHSFFNSEEPIEMFCEFIMEGMEYNYELSLTNKRVISESLVRKKKRSVIIFERKDNEIKYLMKEFSELKKIKLRSNASLISTANQYEITETAPLYRFFFNILTNVSWSGREDFPTDFQAISKYYKENLDALKFTTNVIKSCDLGISNIYINQRENENGEFIYFPIFEHDTDAASKMLAFISQSSGTKELFRILPYYRLVLSTGGVLVLDEFDIKLHPHILPLLIKLFDNKRTNPLDAQMIFTTHNDNIIDYMKKYRLVIVNKDKSESYAYRLDEIPGDLLRNDRPIAPIYNSGKIGGVPKV